MSSRGFAQRFAGLQGADAALGVWRNSLAATPRPTDTATVRKVRGVVAQERVSRLPGDHLRQRGARSRTRAELRPVTTMSGGLIAQATREH